KPKLRKWEKCLKLTKERVLSNSSIKKNHLNLNLNRNPNIKRRTLAMEEGSTGPSTQPQDDASTNIVHESSSPMDAETGADLDKTTSRGDTEIL
nr:hypothetical protein [Tanacetum cinerariifolium]